MHAPAFRAKQQRDPEIMPGWAVKRHALRCLPVDRLPLALIEFPADDTDRALRFWSGVLSLDLAPRTPDQGSGWQSPATGPALGVHARGRGPGDSVSLPYFEVTDLEAALARVREFGGSVVHPGERWAVCRDSEGSPFALATTARQSD